MNSAILLLIAAQAGAQPPLIPAFFTGERLYEICSRPNAGQCSMYVAGVLDGLFYARSRGGMPVLCPTEMNNQEATQIVVDFLAQRPHRQARAAAFVVRQALTEQLSCDAVARASDPTSRR